MRAILPAVVVTALLGAATGQAGCNNQLPYVSEDHFAAEYAQALCTSLQPCCSQNGVTFNYSSCAAGWEAYVNNVLFGPNATGNYDTTVATNCINQVRAAVGASCQPGGGGLPDARATCQAIFAGEVPLGAPCTSAAQCAQMDGSVVTCAVVPGDAGGGGGGQLPLDDPGVAIQGLGLGVSLQNTPVCVALPPPDGGATAPPCSSNATAGTSTCSTAGTYCDPTSKTCLPTNAVGGACDPAVVSSCQPGNYCAPVAGGPAACVAAGPIGSPCTSSAMCDSTGTCDTAATHTCIAILQPGTACTSNSQCSIGVCDPTANVCLKNSIATTATCNGNIPSQ
jgi:hypothetical protein